MLTFKLTYFLYFSWRKKLNFLKFNTLYIEVTHSCNQNCKHCYLDCSMAKEKMPMSLEQIKDILLNFKLQGGHQVIITGGEPFVRKDIFEIDKTSFSRSPFI